jgi:hypothetical protein
LPTAIKTSGGTDGGVVLNPHYRLEKDILNKAVHFMRNKDMNVRM